MPSRNPSECVLIIAPVGQDARAMAELLNRHGFLVKICPDSTDACRSLIENAGVLLLTEEALESTEGEILFEALRNQPTWSELPVIILTDGGESRMGELLDSAASAAGGITLLERPLTANTLLRSAEVALRSRRRQYQVRDLLEKQRHHQELMRQTEDRYRAFIANSSEGIWRMEFEPPLDTTLPVEKQVDLAYENGRLVECNDAMARMYGLQKAEDLIGKGIGFMLPPSNPGAREQVACVIRAGFRVNEMESMEQTASGDTVFFSNSMVGLVKNNHLLRMWGTQRDITERRRAETALRESEARYRTLFESIDEGFAVLEMIFDPQGKAVDYRYIKVNSAFDRQTGMTNVTGRTARELNPNIEEQWIETFARVATTGEAIRFQRFASTIQRWLDVYAFQLPPANERKVALLFSDITERTKAGEATARLAAIVEFSEDAIVSKDLNGIITTWNHGAERLFGYTAEEAIGRPITIIIPPDRHQEEEIILEQIRRRKPIEHFETIRRCKDGRLLDISLTVSPIIDRNGQIIGASKIARDITERKQAEKLLERRAREHAALYRFTDRLNRIRSLPEAYNAALEIITGVAQCDRAAILLLDDAGAMQFVASKGLSEEYRKAVQGHSPWNSQVESPEPISINDVESSEIPDDLKPILRREGIRALAFVPLTLGGKLTGKFMIYHNEPHEFSSDELEVALTISRQLSFGIARRRAEAALRESENRYRTLVEQVKDYAIFHMDNQGKPTSWNEGVQRVFGFNSAAEFVGQDVTRLIFTPEDIEAGVPQEELKEAAETGTAGNDRWMRRQDGTRFFASGVTTGLRDEAGRHIGYTKVVRDYTAAKLTSDALAEARAKLQEYADNLERLVAERTRDLRTTNEQLEAFVYSIAHDLRAPLRSMSGFSQLLMEDYAPQLDETAQHLLKRIQASAEFMDKLLMDLLAYGRTARSEMELTAVEVHKAWQAALFQCATQIETSRAEVKAIEPLPIVQAHEPTLGQCLANLLSNALKFVAPGNTPRVRLWAEDRGDNARLWVEDNGIGIPAEQHERAFRVFERLHGARFLGTGIGLSIVRKGIERMGGRVGLESEPGKGSRFWIELPKAKS